MTLWISCLCNTFCF